MPRENANDGVPLEHYLRRRRGRKIAFFIVLALVAVILVYGDHHGWFGGAVTDMARYDGRTFTVASVVDGDTLDLATPDGSKPVTRVRFWGVDAPEMDHPGNPRPREPYALEATEFTRRRVEGKTVRLRLQEHRPRERYGRVLAYVELTDGATVNEELLAAGFARADERWVHDRSERFKRLEDQAKHESRGIWSDYRKRPATNPAAAKPGE